VRRDSTAGAAAAPGRRPVRGVVNPIPLSSTCTAAAACG